MGEFGDYDTYYIIASTLLSRFSATVYQVNQINCHDKKRNLSET